MAKRTKALPTRAWLVPRVRAARVASLAFLLGLMALLTVNDLFVANLHGARAGVILAIELIPLALVLPGVLAGSARAHAWTCFLVNLYFIKGVLAVFDPARTVYGSLAVGLSLGLFVSALLYTRWQGQWLRLSD